MAPESYRNAEHCRRDDLLFDDSISSRDEKCTEKIDIYSLSMMMWEMLTSKVCTDISPPIPHFIRCLLPPPRSLNHPPPLTDHALFLLQLPWDGSNFQDVRQAVAHLGERPPIPADTPLDLADLLRFVLEGRATRILSGLQRLLAHGSRAAAVSSCRPATHRTDGRQVRACEEAVGC